jgi:hypothetical protein
MPKEFDMAQLDGRLNTAADFAERFPGFPDHVYPILERCQREKDEREAQPKPPTPPPEGRDPAEVVKTEGKFLVKF